MLKTKEKKEVDTFSFEEIEHTYGDQLNDYENMYRLEKDGKFANIIVTTRTSSCGSIQLCYYESVSFPTFTKTERQNFLNYIIDTYEDYNHIYFIDKENGYLENFFSDLGFNKTWSYLNKNTENYVHMWCYNKWSDEEVKEMLNNEEDDW